MSPVFRDDAPYISEGKLRHREGHPVLFLVLLVLLRISIEPRLRHRRRLTWVWRFSHIYVWIPGGSACAFYRGANRRASAVVEPWCDASRTSGLGARSWRMSVKGPSIGPSCLKEFDRDAVGRTMADRCTRRFGQMERVLEKALFRLVPEVPRKLKHEVIERP